MHNYKKIKLFITDLDGTLTDGMYYCTDSGSVMKAFFNRDFYGLQLLQESGIGVLIITAADDEVINRKIEMLPSHMKSSLVLLKGAYNKAKVLEQYLESVGLFWDEITFMGDAGNDLECMQKAGITACPRDAEPNIRVEANYITDAVGGKGAVYEFALYILEKRAE